VAAIRRSGTERLKQTDSQMPRSTAQRNLLYVTSHQIAESTDVIFIRKGALRQRLRQALLCIQQEPTSSFPHFEIGGLQNLGTARGRLLDNTAVGKRILNRAAKTWASLVSSSRRKLRRQAATDHRCERNKQKQWQKIRRSRLHGPRGPNLRHLAQKRQDEANPKYNPKLSKVGDRHCHGCPVKFAETKLKVNSDIGGLWIAHCNAENNTRPVRKRTNREIG
jgi:hypothetical protein